VKENQMTEQRTRSMVITIKNSCGAKFILNTDEWPELHSAILQSYNPDKSESKMWLKIRFKESTPKNLIVYFGYKSSFDKDMVFHWAVTITEDKLDESLAALHGAIRDHSENFYGNDAKRFDELREQFLASLPVVI
jgi:hypothetical protein